MASSPGQRIMAELRADPCRSDRAIARAAQAEHKHVGRLRQRLEGYGVIEPRPRPPSAARRAERELRADPARSDALIAPAARCTPQHVGRIRHQLEQAGVIEPAPQRVSQTRPGRPPAQAARPPSIPELPAPPDWSRGMCTTVPPSQRAWWTSADLSEREAAQRMCAACPVLAECERWSMCLPLTDASIYAGLSQNERRRRRRAMLDELARQATEGLRLRLPWPHARPGWLLVVQDCACARPRAQARAGANRPAASATSARGWRARPAAGIP
jgi:hypothetical protein